MKLKDTSKMHAKQWCQTFPDMSFQLTTVIINGINMISQLTRAVKIHPSDPSGLSHSRKRCLINHHHNLKLTASVQQGIDKLTSQLADVRAMIEATTLNLAVRPKQTVAHIGMQFERENIPSVWRTKCGWQYSLARFFRIPTLSDEFRQCKKCFSVPDSNEEEQDSTDHETEGSSGSESSEPSS